MGKKKILITRTQRAAIHPYRCSSRFPYKDIKKWTRKKKYWDALKMKFTILHASNVEKKNTAFCNNAIAAEDQCNRNHALCIGDDVHFKHDLQVSREVGFMDKLTQEFSKLSINSNDSVVHVPENLKYSVDQERTCNYTENEVEGKKEDKACTSAKDKSELGLSNDVSKLHALLNLERTSPLSRNNVVIDKQSMTTLESPRWIDDSVINSFLGLIADDKHYVFRVQLWNQDWDQPWMSTDVVLSNFEWIFMPIYIPNHWILLVANIPTMSICVLDSGNNDNTKYIAKFRMHMQLAKV
ncbi:uncharacterized protein LOC117103335 isoform X2 [Anneissia japonica]|uniref:uncharacterized protein LOC117103335 isoform X2 n=1 Tax=Anneissia japonica TaxID=1529436 RepID=UPI0014255E0B|nr:uncharacterized protein LOC117103335 isoform X2 [Anneissia japonica]